jgi:methylated-DNA-[protein]-cysteine S-methyltransferase
MSEKATPVIESELKSPVGAMLLVTRGDTLLSLDFEGFEPRFRTLLDRRVAPADRRAGVPSKVVQEALQAYFDGDGALVEKLATDPGGTDFQRKVWAALRTIPSGETRTYGEIARQIGRPTASRAVGAANGQNPIAIVVPCHRVIGEDGALTGYAGGLERKKWLLQHEARPGSPHLGQVQLPFPALA